MATLVPLAEVIASFETDLPDVVLLRKIGAAENEVRAYITADDRPTLPAENISSLPTTIDAGTASTSLTFEESVRSQPMLRFDGKYGESETLFWAIIEIPESTDDVTATPMTADGPDRDEEFDVSVADDGMTVTVKSSDTTSDMTIMAITSFTEVFEDHVQEAIIRLVRIGMNQDGLMTQTSGDYTESRINPSDERNRILARMVYAGSTSLVA